RGEVCFRVTGPIDTAALSVAVQAVGYRPLAIEVEGADSGSAVQPASPQARHESYDEYDLAIVGSGGAAFAAAIRARDRGARVVMIERGTLGGTCVNVGCVPSKTLLRAGEIYHLAGHHPFAGIATQVGRVEMAALVRQKDELVAELRRRKYEDLIGEYGWELVRGEAAFVDPHTLAVGDSRIRARSILIATGARPAVPAIPGLAEAGYLTSTTALSLDHVPESVAVIGSGYVALELGQWLARLGAKVTLMQRSPRFLGAYDPEVGEVMAEVLRDEGIELLTGVRYERVEGGREGRRVRIEVGGHSRAVEAEAILVAAGRQPNTEALRLDRAGVEVGARGEVRVDAELRTNVPHILAAGDVTAGPQFVYVAAYEGGVAAENALGAHKQVDLSVVPTVTFTSPAIATVGLTEVRARQARYDVKTSLLPLSAVPRALVNRDSRGLFKLVAEAATGRVLGAQIVAENAGDAVYAATLAVRFQLTLADLTDTLAPYLTMAEGIRLAAQAFGRDVSLLSCCAG
ncbi:MAG: mercury(II) reductase, partial [Clostridia bacterium]|nr:mercury(II) reductase [Clostridia bacterium]